MKDPCRLPHALKCIHRFCRTCLLDLFMSSRTASIFRSAKCPLCKNHGFVYTDKEIDRQIVVDKEYQEFIQHFPPQEAPDAEPVQERSPISNVKEVASMISPKALSKHFEKLSISNNGKLKSSLDTSGITITGRGAGRQADWIEKFRPTTSGATDKEDALGPSNATFGQRSEYDPPTISAQSYCVYDCNTKLFLLHEGLTNMR